MINTEKPFKGIAPICGGSYVGKGVAGEAEYVSKGAPATVPMVAIIGSKDAEGVEGGLVEEISPVVASGTTAEGVPRFEVTGHAKPAEAASRLFSMSATITPLKSLRDATAEEAMNT